MVQNFHIIAIVCVFCVWGAKMKWEDDSLEVLREVLVWSRQLIRDRELA